MGSTKNRRISWGLTWTLIFLVWVFGAASAMADSQVEKQGTAILQPGPSPALLQMAAAAIYHGNKKTKVFHKPGCRYYNCKNCVVIFNSKTKAVEAGFRPCKVCRP